MAKKTGRERKAEEEVRTEDAKKAAEEYAAEQRQLQDKLRRKMN
jgi:hypothetical protein